MGSEQGPPLHVLFTMDCLPAGSRAGSAGPEDWVQSGRSIDGFSSILRSAGLPMTLFVTPQAASEHAPMLEDLAGLGEELGLLVHPPTLPAARGGRFLGQYRPDDQRNLVDVAEKAFEDTLGVQARSVRSAMFSASDDTFALLFKLGFRQSSLSSPGRRVGRHGADWVGAEADPHHVSAESRLRKGEVPFLEVPVTTDGARLPGGIPQDLAIENGTADEWHRPLIEGQLKRFERERVAFRALCFYTTNRRAYLGRERMAEVLKGVVGYLRELGERYTLVPVTLSAAHAEFRRLPVGG